MIYNDIPKPEIVSDINKMLKISILGYENSEHNTHNMNIGGKNNVQRLALIAKEPDNIESLAWTEVPVISNRAQIQVIFYKT